MYYFKFYSSIYIYIYICIYIYVYVYIYIYVYISFSFIWTQKCLMVNIRSDKIQALIESNLEVKFKELQLSLTEEVKQYSRRLCVRITGISSQKNEFSEDVRNSVKSIIEESGCDILDIALDRSH